MSISELYVFYRCSEYLSAGAGEIEGTSVGISQSPYKVAADLLRKYRITRRAYELKNGGQLKQSKVAIRQPHWTIEAMEKEAWISFTVYWHPGMTNGSYHIFNFETQISRTLPEEKFTVSNSRVDVDKYVYTLRRWETDFRMLIGSEVSFIPIMVTMAMRDSQHVVWNAGNAKGIKLEI